MNFKEFALNEVSEVKKGIFFYDGKKVDGERKGKIILGSVDKDNNLTVMNWNDYKKSSAKSDNSESAEKSFISALLKTLEFNKRVDFNTWLKRSGEKATFEQKVDYILGLGAKYSKTGLNS